MRFARSDAYGPKDHAESVIVEIEKGTSMAERARLLSRLLSAIADQLDGTGSPGELDDAVSEAIRYRKPRKFDPTGLSQATTRNEIIAAIHDVAMNSRKLPKDGTDKEFKEAARRHRSERLPIAKVSELLRQADAAELAGRSALFRDALRDSLADRAGKVIDHIVGYFMAFREMMDTKDGPPK